MTRVIAVVGSYRRGGITESAVDAVLAGAKQAGAEVKKVHLLDRNIEFCRNCRMCTQEPGVARATCVQDDDMEDLLREIEGADGLVLASPVNYWNVTALFRRFMERLLVYTWWPWGKPAPAMRSRLRTRKAVLVTSAGMPGWLIRLTTGAPRALKGAASMLGARTVGHLWIGLAASDPAQELSTRERQRAARLGRRLA